MTIIKKGWIVAILLSLVTSAQAIPYISLKQDKLKAGYSVKTYSPGSTKKISEKFRGGLVSNPISFNVKYNFHLIFPDGSIDEDFYSIQRVSHYGYELQTETYLNEQQFDDAIFGGLINDLKLTTFQKLKWRFKVKGGDIEFDASIRNNLVNAYTDFYIYDFTTNEVVASLINSLYRDGSMLDYNYQGPYYSIYQGSAIQPGIVELYEDEYVYLRGAQLYENHVYGLYTTHSNSSGADEDLETYFQFNAPVKVSEPLPINLAFISLIAFAGIRLTHRRGFY